MCRSILSFLLFFLSLPLYSQYGQLRFDNFTLEDGLSNNIVHCIYQDTRGWLWFGTSQGLSRFDGYNFTVFKSKKDDPSSLSGSLVRVVFEDKNGDLWIGTENGGLNKFNRDKENFTRFSSADISLFGTSVNTIVQDKNGYLWIGSEKGLTKMNPETGKAIAYFNHAKNALSNNFVRTLLFDHKGNLWIGTNDGLDCLNPYTTKFKSYSLPYLNRTTDEIHSLYEDKDGTLWIGTYNSGLFTIDPEKKITRINPDPGNDRSLTVRAINRNTDDTYWIGTRGGLYLYSKEKRVLSLLKHDEREPASLSHSSVLCIYPDRKGDIWIGTRGGISYLAREKQIFRQYSAMSNNNNYLNDNEIFSFWMSKDNEIWIGTERGGVNILDRKTGKFTYLLRNPNNSNSLSKNCIKAFLDDQKGNVWVGTFMGGIDVINIKNKKIVSHHIHQKNDPSSLVDNRIWSLFRDRQGNMWIGTVKGLDRFDPVTNKFEHYSHISGPQNIYWIDEDDMDNLWMGNEEEIIIYNLKTKKISKYKERTRSFCMDSKGRIWLANLEKGLALFDRKNKNFTYYDESDGLSNNQALCILEDNAGMLWISTGNGLSRFDPEKKIFKNFDRRDGLQNNQFSYGAAYKAPSGELLFGGIAGFNIFNPLNVRNNEYRPPIVFTGLKIFNKTVPVTDNGILTKSISETKKIVLDYNHKFVTFEFAALNFAQSHKNQYEFMLEGFDKDWNHAGNQHSATYTNLNPGEYVFRVRASNNDNQWNVDGIKLAIKVLPPFWKTWWFKSLLVISILIIIYLLVYFQTNKSKLKHKLVYERMRAHKMHELDMMKLQFFTNISHEIRTPLTLILGPIEKIQKNDMSKQEIRSYIDVVHRNARQLLRLINQLLDYRKLEAGNLKLELSKGDVIQFTREVVNSFAPLANEKNISLMFAQSTEEAFVWFDPDKLEKIINNLLSNAIKFTEKEGSVRVNISVSNPSDNNNRKIFEIVVKDSGIGIPDHHINKIFNRFFQSNENQNNTGTGIGLALTKELVKLHDGQIFVESRKDKGTKFVIRLPFDTDPHESPEVLHTEMAVTNESKPAGYDTGLTKDTIMIIEDNSDVRYFIRDNFEPEFNVLEASDGKEGWQQAVKLIPDVIICDVLMPGMNGKELCKKLKKDERTSHIPIILLTALTSKDNEQEGLVAGADDYITKPFDIDILKTKVENLLLLRKSLKEKYTHEMVIKPTNVIISSPDERFLQKAIEVVEKNIDDPDLDIDKFATEISVSRMQLYRKLAALTNMTVKEFIRDIRLKRAAQMLVQKKMTISEVAYSVGFRDISHFRKCFRQQFGMNASEYMEQNEESPEFEV